MRSRRLWSDRKGSAIMGDFFDTQFRRVLLKLHASIVDRVDSAAKADGLDRAEWLRRAALEKLAKSKLQRKGPHQ